MTLGSIVPRLAEPPHVVLGVAEGASPEVLRAAFLQLTKQYHPQKFARFAPDVVRLANEVFLTIKRAYDQLSTAQPSVRAVGTAPPARATTTPPPPTRPTTAAPRATTTPGTAAPPRRPPQPAPQPKVSYGGAAPPSPTELAWQEGMDLLRRRLWGEARQVFLKLALGAPTEKKYRSHMHYARAEEARAAGRPDEARAELQRALVLEPDLAPAKRALAELPPEPPSGGLFSKIFKR